MKLLCDEDIGTSVPKALALVGYPAHSMYDVGWRSRSDIDWLPDAAAAGYLVFSNNKRMLLVQGEKDAIEENNLGIVFLTNGEERLADVLRLLLNKWKWLEEIDRQPKPFVYFLSPKGRVTTSHRLKNGVRLSLR